MELEEIKNLWKGHEEKLERSLELNKKLFEQIHLDKTRGKMRSLLFVRIAEAVCFLIFLIALLGYVADHLNLSASTISAIILSVFCMIGLAGSIGQIALVSMLDYSGSVRDIQQQIFRVRSHKIQLLRLILLSIPFYMAYIFLGFDVLWDIDLFTVVDPVWLTIQITFSVLLIGPVIWLCRVLGLKGKPRPWVTKFLTFFGDAQITQALALLTDLEEDGSEQKGA